MPFLPVILLLAWQALSRGAAFGLGWATALFFGQIPGNKGRVVSVVALIGAAWVIVTVGAGVPIAGALIGHALSLLPGDAPALDPRLLAALAAAIVLLPPVTVGFIEIAGFDRRRSLGRWLRRIPASYLLAGSIGVAVIEMILITPVLALRRRREGRTFIQVPIVISGKRGKDLLADDIERLLRSLGYEPQREELRGPMSWPLRTMEYAARQMLETVVEGRPQRLTAGRVEIIIHATDVAITAPDRDAYRIRAAIERELALSDTAYLTWSEDSQKLEAALLRAGRDHGDRSDRRSVAALVERLDEIQDRIDRASLKSDEWNLLYRVRLQLERQARVAVMDSGDGREARRRVQRAG
ncbi:MAG: hypothetical protein M3295_05690 [Chloroflexota bacterium]|nr:hypothetical protein [Chloroflexota bacterium]